MVPIIKTVFYNFVLLSSLSQQEQDLLQQAANVRNNAQAPYSEFYVGVAVCDQYGVVHTGCNVERCSYSQTTHAEQNAIDGMIAMNGASKITCVALVAAPKDVKVTFKEKKHAKAPESLDMVPLPCGHCLQCIWENCLNDESVKVLSYVCDGIVLVTTIGDLFPARFGPTQLGIHYEL